MTHEPHNVSETVETLEDLASGAEEVLVADVLREFGKRSFGPFLLVPALPHHLLRHPATLMHWGALRKWGASSRARMPVSAWPRLATAASS